MFKQFEFDLNIPTAEELLLQVLYLEHFDENDENFLRRLSPDGREKIKAECVKHIVQSNYMQELSQTKSQMAIAVASLNYEMY